jgi:hypothetical protein
MVSDVRFADLSGVCRLIRGGELHVGLRDFDDDVLIGDTYQLKLDVNFEIWTVLANKGLSAAHPEKSK